MKDASSMTVRSGFPVKLLALCVVSISLAGCAVQKMPGGKISIGIDNAELLGQTVATFKLEDGSEGRLRVLGGKYSIKLQQHLRVVDIPLASMVRLMSSSSVGGRTLLVLEKSDRSCDMTQVMSIKGPDVLIWDIGDCRSQPEVTIEKKFATFDFVRPQRTTRYVYRDAGLFRGEVATAAIRESALPAAVDNRGSRYVPGPPVTAPQPRATAPNSGARTSC